MRHFARVHLLLSLLAVPAFCTTTYSIESLGALGSGAASISSGSVGSFTDTGGNLTPAIFSAAGITPLPGVGSASGENSSGVIIGTTYSGATPVAAEWVNGQSQTLFNGYGNAINNAGQIAGGFVTKTGLEAFVQTGSNVKDIGNLGGGWSSANALNASGSAAGTSMTQNGAFHAFEWNGTSMQGIGTLGGWNSYGNGLNNTGEVVGASQTAAGFLNAFSWTTAGMQDLGTLGGSTSAAYGVNDSGEVVGYSLTAQNASTHAFLDAGGVMVDLNSLLPIGSGWTITGAYSIDDQGDILGMGLLNGSQYAVELYQNTVASQVVSASGVPEPAAMALAGVGLLGFAFLGRKTKQFQPARSSDEPAGQHGNLQE